MKRAALLLNYIMMSLASILGAGSVLLFATTGRASVVTIRWPESALLLWDAMLERRDLAYYFGDAYREYQRKVPMLVPWRRPVIPET